MKQEEELLLLEISFVSCARIVREGRRLRITIAVIFLIFLIILSAAKLDEVKKCGNT